MSPARRALVFGGSGAVGAEVVRGLVARGVTVTFTWWQSRERALALADATGAAPLHLDLRDAEAIRDALYAMASTAPPDVLVHCAALGKSASLTGLTDTDWDEAHAVNARAPFVAVHALTPHWMVGGGADVVLVGALDRAQTLPLPVAFAASQGTLPALAMALARELGPQGIRVNVLAAGVLDAGLGATLAPAVRADYLEFSALRRVGQPTEIARAAVWLALENRFMNGKVLPVNGGI
ncbi:MAG: SDR family oxidoreductase [Myxococcales bacterium]|nr:SDR family oxidoreductase [Myxococcales bacterium]